MITARPYAKAAFAYAKAQNTLPQWQAFLSALAALVETPVVTTLLNKPHLPTDALLRFFTAACRLTEEQAPMQRYLAQLIENQRIRVAPHIATLFQALFHQHQKILPVVVATPYPLDPAQQTALQAALATRYQCDITMKTERDPTLLGGILVRIGDVVIDGSLKNKLSRLQTLLLGLQSPTNPRVV